MLNFTIPIPLILAAALPAVLDRCSGTDTSVALGILARDRVALTATASEIVVELPVAEGTVVKAGDTLVQLDPTLQSAKLALAQAELEKAHGAERQQLQDKIDELNRRLANPEEALAQQHAKILDLEARLERLGNRIGGDRLNAAREALHAGEFTLADDIFAEIDAARELDVQEAASAAFGAPWRGSPRNFGPGRGECAGPHLTR